ncbi:MAG: hypothetical protein R3F19_23260 [Verrucomicrobiales bacterium]
MKRILPLLLHHPAILVFSAISLLAATSSLIAQEGSPPAIESVINLDALCRDRGFMQLLVKR